MRRLTHEFYHDLKEMGIHLWIVMLTLLVFLILTYFVQLELNAVGRINNVTLPMLEALVPSMGGYGALMLMQGLLDAEGGELAFSYPRTRLYWGLIRQLRFFILFTIVVAAVSICLASIMRTSFMPIFSLTLAQSFAVMGVAFLGITATNKISLGMVVLVGFVGIQIMIGREFSMLNWIYVLSGAIGRPLMQANGMRAFNALVIGIFGWVMGQTWLRPPDM